MVARIDRVVTYHEELPLIKLHGPSMSFYVISRDKFNAIRLHLH